MAGQKRLGELLLEMGFIDVGQLEAALVEQGRSGRRLGQSLVQAGVITEDRLVHALSRQLGIEACDPIMTPVHPRVLALVPREAAFAHRVLPVARQRDERGEIVYVATADPLDAAALAALRRILGEAVRIRWMLAGETEVELALVRHYGSSPDQPLGAQEVRAEQPARAPRSAPAGLPVIRGVPVSGPPQERGPPLGQSEALDLGPLLGQSPAPDLEPAPPAPPPAFDLDGGPSDPHADLARLSGHLADEVARESLEAEEVIESGSFPPLSRVDTPALQTGDWPPVVLEAPRAPAPPLLADPGPSWGDLLPGDGAPTWDMAPLEEVAPEPSASTDLAALNPTIDVALMEEVIDLVPLEPELSEPELLPGEPVAEDIPIDELELLAPRAVLDEPSRDDLVAPPDLAEAPPAPELPAARAVLDEPSLDDLAPLAALAEALPEAPLSLPEAPLAPSPEAEASRSTSEAPEAEASRSTPEAPVTEVQAPRSAPEAAAPPLSPAEAPRPRLEAPSIEELGPRPVASSSAIAQPLPSPEEMSAVDVRDGLLRFVAGEILDTQTNRFLMRVVAAVLVHEGLLDDERLTEALARLRR